MDTSERYKRDIQARYTSERYKRETVIVVNKRASEQRKTSPKVRYNNSNFMV